MPMERPLDKDYMYDLVRLKCTTNYLEDYVDTMSHATQKLRYGI